MAYLLFVSTTILFCKCAVATVQRCPSIRQALSLSPRYIYTINKGEGLRSDSCFDFIIFILFILCPPHTIPFHTKTFSAGVAGSLWITEDSATITLGESYRRITFCVLIQNRKIICEISDCWSISSVVLLEFDYWLNSRLKQEAQLL